MLNFLLQHNARSYYFDTTINMREEEDVHDKDLSLTVTGAGGDAATASDDKNEEGKNDDDETELKLKGADDESKSKTESANVDEKDILHTSTKAGGISLPTKANDGGADEQPSEWQAIAALLLDGIGSPPSSVPQDSFRTFSDTDTRMSTLLGLDLAANPADWRRLIGFQGLGGRRRNNDDNREGEDGHAAPNADGNGNGGETTPRKTRLSWELHPDAFGYENM